MKSLRGLKVGLVCPFSFSYPGGVQEHVKSLAMFLQKKGINAKIIIPRAGSREDYGPGTSLLGGCFSLPLLGSQTNISFAAAPSVQEFLSAEKFDLLHFHNPFSPFLPWQILENFEGPSVGTLHANPDSEESRVLPFMLDFLNMTVAPKINRFIIVSGVARQVLWKKYYPLTTTIPNGIDLKRFRLGVPPIKKWRSASGRINILYVGRIDERKGLPYLLAAFKRLQTETDIPLRLLVAGEGELKHSCQKTVAREKIKNVVFLGYIRAEALPNYYASADIFCSPAVFGESFGVVLLEAMASGLPVVAFANNGYREVLTGEGARYAVKVKDVALLAAALKTLVENPEERLRMRAWGLAEVKKYSWAVVGEQVLRVYREALAAKR